MSERSVAAIVAGHIEPETRLRPQACRVEEYYESNYVQFYGWREFFEMNLAACATLREMDI